MCESSAEVWNSTETTVLNPCQLHWTSSCDMSASTGVAVSSRSSLDKVVSSVALDGDAIGLVALLSVVRLRLLVGVGM